ncbi:RNA polymerase sigma factor for late transcription [Synechococcus phage S-B68]|nr:RNA polymerase sigma factor for late transcription [Synechococcus phage S-B68]
MNPAPRKRRKNNFIDNKEFYAAIVDHRQKCDLAEQRGEDLPILPRYIGKCFLDIAEHLSMRPNFSNYMYRQDMVMDAVENCVLYWRRFDPEKSKNPFSYFTQVCWYAFIRRIGKEKKQIEICDKIISRSGFEELFQSDALGSSADYNSIKDAVDQRRRNK